MVIFHSYVSSPEGMVHRFSHIFLYFPVTFPSISSSMLKTPLPQPFLWDRRDLVDDRQAWPFFHRLRKDFKQKTYKDGTEQNPLEKWWFNGIWTGFILWKNYDLIGFYPMKFVI